MDKLEEPLRDILEDRTEATEVWRADAIEQLILIRARLDALESKP